MKESEVSERHALERLKTLYGISKLLSIFESVEISFPEILALTSNAFPLSTAVLIEHWEKKPKKATWHSADATEEQVDRAILNARDVYHFLSGATALDAITTSKNKFSRTGTSQSGNTGKLDNFIVLPLIINKLPPFGVLQLEGADPLNEHDLEFAAALADLISVALDRYYTTKKATELISETARENKDKLTISQDEVSDLETERDLRESFVSLLTHDLRTPLSAALMSAQLILRKSEDPQMCIILAGRIVSNINRSDHMISNLLDANRIRSGEKLPLSVSEFDLSVLIKETLEELTTIHGDRFLFHGEGKVEGFWDRKGVRRIIENLCNNAIKYGSKYSPVTLTLRSSEKEVQLSVQNLGNVISIENKRSLFQQYRRGEKAPGEGWGIGLTLVRGVADAHGGSATVTSDGKNGTVFTITLPIDSRSSVS